MKIAIFANIRRKMSFDLAKEVSEFLQSKKISVYTRDEDADFLGIPKLSTLKGEPDFLISMGGDGSILRLVHSYPEINAPIFGINLGHLGFLTETSSRDALESLSLFLQGDYEIEKRMMMEGVSPDGKHFFALNETVIHRSKIPCLIDLSIHVNKSYLNTFSADGIIVSTPSGSTAYSLAAGGPILAPTLDAFVITPICPHTISNRPIVIAPHEKIEIQYLSSYEPIEIIFDGFARFTLSSSDILTIYKSKKTFNLVKLTDRDFFSTLRTKLGWSGQVRYNQLNLIESEKD